MCIRDRLSSFVRSRRFATSSEMCGNTRDLYRESLAVTVSPVSLVNTRCRLNSLHMRYRLSSGFINPVVCRERSPKNYYYCCCYNVAELTPSTASIDRSDATDPFLFPVYLQRFRFRCARTYVFRVEEPGCAPSVNRMCAISDIFVVVDWRRTCT